jgi:hypothetical protein
MFSIGDATVTSAIENDAPIGRKVMITGHMVANDCVAMITGHMVTK